ncbi:ferritin-like domain-containing protein [Mucilaginibacter daejeonensis]|uniref:ferritin-like domain-containing protein n=1 Tax=Mucilaginibacter daejeonensis TaxID=398049 RepID=UPI001D1766BA|nr:ferritin-like domain-containing protein [Mucilaginibacter daejeonensis]UEG54506.1 ferritin-like domain-containing protein [Mucilaginibacter daejeonensis]
MITSKNWIAYFKVNAGKLRIDWSIAPQLSMNERCTIITSMQAWQLGETSEGRSLIKAATRHAEMIGDDHYIEAVRLFMKEEQKHGENLGRYLDAIGEQRIKKNWDDSLFRWARHINTSMESFTLAVLLAESTAQIYYQALKDATQCTLLKQICTDILIDEARHITFQTERLGILYDSRSTVGRLWRRSFYQLFFYGAAALVWIAHRKVFSAGGNTFKGYMRKIHYKYLRTLHVITAPKVLATHISF